MFYKSRLVVTGAAADKNLLLLQPDQIVSEFFAKSKILRFDNCASIVLDCGIYQTTFTGSGDIQGMTGLVSSRPHSSMRSNF